MKSKILKIVYLVIILSICMCMQSFAGKYIPESEGFPVVNPNSMNMSEDGTCTWIKPDDDTGVYKIKRYAIQLLKRITTTTSGGLILYIYDYKTSGSTKYVSVDENEYVFNFGSTGYYQFRIRCEDLEGNYGDWRAIYDNDIWWNCKETYPGIAITEENISIGVNTGSGSGGGSTGPGIAQTSQLPAGYQYAVVGPNGEILYYYGGNTSNWQYNNMGQYAMSGNNQYYGPGYVNNGNATGQVITPNTGVSNYQQVQTPNVFGNQMGNSTYNPNMYGGFGNNYATPQINQNMQIGWQVDNVGRFYYQGNGNILRGTWYFIDGAYYRFNDNGYVLTNQWFKDPNTNFWYYLTGDGKMLVGWQKINDVWYYFKPENGNGYGAMYANTSIFINDPIWGSGQYAFDSNGAMIKNAWYNNAYFGNDGRKTN